MINEMNGKKCILCGKEFMGDPLMFFDKMPASAQDIPSEDELEEEKEIDLSLYQCDGCGLVQFDCKPVDYYKDVIRLGGYSTTMTELRKDQYNHLIEKYHLEKKKIIEIGCGQGEYLEVLKSFFDVQSYGIENREILVHKAREKGLNVKQGFVTDSHIFEENEKYDAFLMFNFLEHQPEPNKMLQSIYAILSDSGIGLITVPSFEYMMKYGAYYELMRDHIAYYTFDTLRILVETNGFEVLEQEIINRDTISVIIKKRGKCQLQSMKEGFRTVKQDFYKLIENYREEGKKIAIWGASHQGFTIAASLELGNDIAYIVDSAPFKQGKYSPGSHIKIISPKEFYNNPSDVIIIIAPGYSDEIRRNIEKECKSEIEIYTLMTNHLERL